MRWQLAAAAVSALILATGAQAAAQTSQAETPEQIKRLLACRSIDGAEQRLACFDRETAATAEAIGRKDLVAMDREKVRATRRSLFGFSVPKIGLFGGDGEEEVKQVEGVIAGVGWSRDGVRVRLQDESRWAQIDTKPFAIEPRAGDKVVIRRGLLGSYMMSVAGQPGIKVQRVN